MKLLEALLLEDKIYQIPFNARIKVSEGEVIEKGTPLTDGSLDPHDLLDILGSDAVHAYIVREVQKVYRMTGVDISDKHIEVIVRQMMKKVRIEDSGDTNFLIGSMVDYLEVERANIKMEEEGKRKAVFVQELLGITKALNLMAKLCLPMVSFNQ